MVETKKPAKTTAKTTASVADVVLTQRVCAHCGERIALNKIVTIRRLSYDDQNKQHERKIFFAVGHAQVEKV